MTSTVLIVDDMPDVRMSADYALSDQGFAILEAESPQQALALLTEHEIDVVLFDMNYTRDTTSGEEGLAFLEKMQSMNDTFACVAMTAWSSVDLAIQAIKKGASDFIEKPWDNQRLLQIVTQQTQLIQLRRQNRALRQQCNAFEAHNLLWRSRPMLKLKAHLERLATTDATILLTGENGCGKSSIAKVIHQLSGRRDASFVTVNMGAIPESLFESEMFGHRRGAFTDARENRIGRFEMATGGTLFLDEIANIPLAQQAKLLRVLESREYEPVGSSRTQKANARIVCATNANFEELLSQGTFRTDLYYRLNTIELRIPPLRERRDDIMPLAYHFAETHATRYQRPKVTFSPEAEKTLLEYEWPGNIRELSHTVERAILLTHNAVVESHDLHLRFPKSQTHQLPLMTLDEAEHVLITKALDETGGVVAEAAQILGISKSAMYRRMEKFGIKA
ncbi:Sigma-54-dependent Fis family transcriptional regulator [Sulfidibacter corallicola]|uniref:Sigma-54-dependent Fis family transcriptional regulator n=1 Tax=Sulfidibacter corallicola TaxID=2818388 RepID=A0A8A4TPC6_SULCO|nr:sigma-54 dependent transcriptional regulator [Sulfidibacter corallicola]QTD50942.1 sigma-54-dependent Fis family transcriptional regulator [Sulfidibacter corallicola]